MQISAYRRDSEDITHDDLLDFAEDELVEGIELLNLQCGEFTGIGFTYLANGDYWRKWWLRNGYLLLYVTYNCLAHEHILEIETVNQMMDTLKTPRYGVS